MNIYCTAKKICHTTDNNLKGVFNMGLIKAAMGAAGGAMADQWKEFFYCEALAKDVMVTKGKKRVSPRDRKSVV